MEKIFIIEDDENIRNLVKIALEGYGYAARDFEDAESALACIREEKPDLAVFDLMLPGMDGLEAISVIRRDEEVKDMPIIVLTARDKEYDKVVGLDYGADDYMTKPFGVLELSARVRSLLRRTKRVRENAVAHEIIEAGGLKIDGSAREVRADGVLVGLTYKEFELLQYLVQNRDRVVGRNELLDGIWGYQAEIETRTLDIHIRSLRQKLGEQYGSCIKTVRSVGYRFLMDEENGEVQ